MDKSTITTNKAKEWEARIREIRSSGMTVSMWCREHSLSPRRFYYWEKRLREKPELASLDDGEFYQVPFETEPPLKNSPAVHTEESSSLPVTVVQYASYSVLVTDHTSEETLARVFRVIKDA